MTYLDPTHSTTRSQPGKWVLRVIGTVAILAFGWFAFTVGTQPNGSPTVVQEPQTRSF